MFDDLNHILHFGLSLDQIIYNISVAALCGFFILFMYRVTYTGPSYSRSFANSLVILAILTAVVIMVIGNNLARAFGLVGAMSIIRFRTAIKDTNDIVFIFFSLTAGMATGAGLHGLAIIGSVLVGFFTYLLSYSRSGAAHRKDFLLQFSVNGTEDEEDPTYMPVLKKYCRQHKLVNLKSADNGNMLDLSFYIRLRNQEQSPQFIRELEKSTGVKQVTLFFDEESY